MIKRISPNDPPKIPLKDVKPKVLSKVQVVDPTLTPSEIIAYQKKLQEHSKDYVGKAIEKAFTRINREYDRTIGEEEREADKQEAELDEAHRAEILAQHDFGNENKFRNKLQEMFPDFAESLRYEPKTETTPRPTIASDPYQHIKDAPDGKSLVPHLADPDVRVRNIATQRYKDLQARSKK